MTLSKSPILSRIRLDGIDTDTERCRNSASGPALSVWRRAYAVDGGLLSAGR